MAADKSSHVSELEAELASTRGDLDGAEASADSVGDKVSVLSEELAAVEDELAAERALKGKDTVVDKEDQEYETDFAWGAAGTVGYLVVKPTEFRREGSKWLLTVEAKNEASEPKTLFCGDGGAILGDSEGNGFSGESVLSPSSDSCEEIQPGLSGVFIAEFETSDQTKPATVGIYGDWEQEDEVKFWELPKE